MTGHTTHAVAIGDAATTGWQLVAVSSDPRRAAPQVVGTLEAGPSGGALRLEVDGHTVHAELVARTREQLQFDVVSNHDGDAALPTAITVVDNGDYRHGERITTWFTVRLMSPAGAGRVELNGTRRSI